MRFGVLGTGIVGRTVGGKLVELGHEVMLGSRSSENEKAIEWAAGAGARATHGTFSDAAAFGELIINATGGSVSLQALDSAGAENLNGKVLIDIANPLDFSKGFPPTLSVCNTDSVAEQIQRTFPEAHVVKALNTVNATVMIDPQRIKGGHNLFICGNDEDAKVQVSRLLQDFGWNVSDIIDLGDITNARGTEMYLALWIRLSRALGTWSFNIRLVRPEE